MIDSNPDPKQAQATRATSQWVQDVALGAVCLLVIVVYAGATHLEDWEAFASNPADSYYNLLVQGFRAGQLSLRKEVPPGLMQLADPYNPTANRRYRLGSDRLHDLSYYKGKLYLYFGVTPALLLFWPFVALTGDYLFHGQAVAIFCVAGFLASVGVLRALWRRYFSEVSVWVVAACAVALGLATTVPLMLPRSAYNEAAVSCGYMLTMLTLGAIWCALHEPERRCWWLAAASVAYGLAVGARPSLLLGAVILLVPVAQAWRERQSVWTLLIAAIGPITLVGLGLMLYNALRFDSPFEFGEHYQLVAVRSVGRQYFHLRYFWFDFRAYFLEPARWSAHFPFVHKVAVPPRPAGYDQVETPFGVLTNIPLVWLALVVPLAWRDRSGPAASLLRWFVTAVALSFGTSVSPLLFFDSAIIRYEVDFVPALLLLAVVGLLGLERVPAKPGPQLAGQPVWRHAARWGWGGLLGFSVAFNLLACVGRCAEAHDNLGAVLFLAGRVPEAIEQYERALRLSPDDAGTHYALGIALAKAGKLPEAIEHYEQAVRIKPDDAGIHYNLGGALAEMGKLPEAIEQYEQALRVRPEDAEAHLNLGAALTKLGKPEDAIRHYEEALRLRPDDAEAQMNFGNARLLQGKVTDAIGHYEQALRTNPDYAQAHDNLGIALAQAGRVPEAIRHWEQAVRLKPDDVEAHCNLGNALAQMGRVPEAIEQYEQALKLRPDLTPASNALSRLRGSQ